MRVLTKIAYIALALGISVCWTTLLETKVAYATESGSGADSNSGDSGGERDEKARKKGDNNLIGAVGAELNDIKGQLALLARKARKAATLAAQFAGEANLLENTTKRKLRDAAKSYDIGRQRVLDLLNELVFWQKVAEVPHRQIVSSIKQARLTIDHINRAQAVIRSILN